MTILTAHAQLHTAIIAKMREQLGEMVVSFRENPPTGMSTATRDKTLRDMHAQLDALAFAYGELVRAYGEPPANEAFSKQN